MRAKQLLLVVILVGAIGTLILNGWRSTRRTDARQTLQKVGAVPQAPLPVYLSVIQRSPIHPRSVSRGEQFVLQSVLQN
jgi:hypothetical protein